MKEVSFFRTSWSVFSPNWFSLLLHILWQRASLQLCSELIFVTHSSVKLFCLLTEASGVKYLAKGHNHTILTSELKVKFHFQVIWRSLKTVVLPTNIKKVRSYKLSCVFLVSDGILTDRPQSVLWPSDALKNGKCWLALRNFPSKKIIFFLISLPWNKFVFAR